MNIHLNYPLFTEQEERVAHTKATTKADMRMNSYAPHTLMTDTIDICIPVTAQR